MEGIFCDSFMNPTSFIPVVISVLGSGTTSNPVPDITVHCGIQETGASCLTALCVCSVAAAVGRHVTALHMTLVG